MARKTTTVTIDSTDPGNRDVGKQFVITELPATVAEKWAARALNALLASGLEIPDDLARQGMRGLAASGLAGLQSFSGVPWNLAEPLLDEMMACVQIVPDPTRPGVIRPLVETDIEEVTTRFTLRGEWLGLHFSFFKAAKTQT